MAVKYQFKCPQCGLVKGKVKGLLLCAVLQDNSHYFEYHGVLEISDIVHFNEYTYRKGEEIIKEHGDEEEDSDVAIDCLSEMVNALKHYAKGANI